MYLQEKFLKAKEQRRSHETEDRQEEPRGASAASEREIPRKHAERAHKCRG